MRYQSLTKLPEKSTRQLSGKKDSISSNRIKLKRKPPRLILKLKLPVLPTKLLKKVLVLSLLKMSSIDLRSNSKKIERSPRML